MCGIIAGDRVRTGNIQLGRLMLYQLSYARVFRPYYIGMRLCSARGLSARNTVRYVSRRRHSAGRGLYANLAVARTLSTIRTMDANNSHCPGFKSPSPSTTGKVVIVGAGAVGTTFAYALQSRGVARRIVLIDQNRERAEAEAMDLSHGALFAPPVEITAGDYPDCTDADLVAICAGSAQKPGQTRMDLVSTNVAICKTVVQRVVEYTRDAILLVVTNPVDILTYAAVKYSGLPASQVIGSGTVLDSARLRYLLSRHCRVDARNIHGYVLGEHGDSEFVAWSATTIGGMAIGDYCPACPRQCPPLEREKIAEQVRDSAYHIIEAKGATNYAVGLAMTHIATVILRNENSVLTVSTMLDGVYGLHDVCLSVPVIVNRAGVDRLLRLQLNESEQKALQASAEAVGKVQREAGL